MQRLFCVVLALGFAALMGGQVKPLPTSKSVRPSAATGRAKSTAPVTKPAQKASLPRYLTTPMDGE